MQFIKWVGLLVALAFSGISVTNHDTVILSKNCICEFATLLLRGVVICTAAFPHSPIASYVSLQSLFRTFSTSQKRAADRPRSLKEPFYQIYSGNIKVCLVFRENYKGYLWASWLEAPRVASFLKSTLQGTLGFHHEQCQSCGGATRMDIYFLSVFANP